MSTLKGKVVVITGAGRGLGKAMADILVSKGATVVTSDINNENAAVVADVTKEKDLVVLAEQAVSEFGRIDVWINNAGIWLPKTPVEELDMEKVRALFEINVFGTMNGVCAVVPHMKKQKSGIIVNISSTTAFDGMNGSSGSPYVSSKYAIRGFTNAVREELSAAGVRMIGVYPGGIKTKLFEGQEPAIINNFMTPESVAEKIVANLEKENPEEELIINRPGQHAVHEKN